jgi:threonine/homoserine/homoserine lactone efflux protein
MGNAIGQVLVFAVGVSLSPIPIIGVVVMLSTPRGKVNGLGFLLGWVVGLAAAAAVVLIVAGAAGASTTGDGASGTNWVKVGLGVVLLVVALRQWRKRPAEGETPPMPKWMTAVDHFNPVKSAGLGVLLSAVNPKNLILTVGAASAVAADELSTGDEVAAMAVFVVLATVGPAIPVAIAFLMGDRATALLARLQAWMGRENAVIMAVLCLVIGVKLIGDGVGGL